MKLIKLHINYIWFVLLITSACWAQNDIKGYTIKGDKLTFVFDVDDYPNIKNHVSYIEAVYVSGEFNDWATNRWKMTKVNAKRYELTKDLFEFTSDFDWEFKFIVNGEHWAEPSWDFENVTMAKSETGKPLMVYNLKLYSAFATKYGNVRFKLKGFSTANSVILSGTFNRWDETGFKMKKEKDGWYITLQLRPDTYYYKFIVDGTWMEDPNNPSKVYNEYGGFNSVIDVKKSYEFKLCDFKSAKEVILSGDFNNWSEQELKMTKVDGCWRYTLDLSGGKYHYKFIVDGIWKTDPSNAIVEYDQNGHINSVCIIK